jgi:cytoskeleton protein RodZ
MDEQGSVGQILRQRREERGLGIEQAARQSRVPVRLVQALEADDYHLLPDALYLIRLLHEYANFLQLDASALDAEFRRAVRRPPRPSLAPPITRTGPEIPWKQVLWMVIAILVLTPLIFIALSLASKRAQERADRAASAESRIEEPRSPGEEPMAPQDRLLGTVTPTTIHTAESLAEQVPASGGGASGAPSAGASDRSREAQRAGHHLVARAHEPTWLSVRSDREDRRQVLLQPGQEARFDAKTGFLVTIGNAGGVTFWLDGAPFPLAGRSGEVVRDLAVPPRQGRIAAEKTLPESSRP